MRSRRYSDRMRWGRSRGAPANSYPFFFDVTLDRGSDPLGVMLDPHSATLTVITWVPGAVERYNESAEPNKRVQPQDFLLEVNGKTGTADMVAELRAEQKLTFTIFRALPFKVEVKRAGKRLGARLYY